MRQSVTCKSLSSASVIRTDALLRDLTATCFSQDFPLPRPASPSLNFNLQTRLLRPGRLSRDISTSYGSVRMIPNKYIDNRSHFCYSASCLPLANPGLLSLRLFHSRLLPIQVFSFQELANSPTQRPSHNPLLINYFRTLFIATEGVPPLATFPTSPPGLLHSALPQIYLRVAR
jgi:hypothetical protein